jgi:hypothetical protein
MENGAVTSPKLRDREVRNPEIADSSITSAKIMDGSILLEDLRTGTGMPGGSQEVSEGIFNICSIDFHAVAAQKVGTAF